MNSPVVESTSMLQTMLDVPVIRRIRRNHGLEHATIHLMSRRVRDLKMVGRSDAKGFWLYGEVDTDVVEDCVTQALNRMSNGEHRLAIHPNCGTNLVTVAFLGGIGAMVALTGSEKEQGGKWGRLPLVITMLMIALIFGQPLGMQIQEHVTTDGDPADLVVKEIRRVENAGLTMHRVETWSS